MHNVTGGLSTWLMLLGLGIAAPGEAQQARGSRIIELSLNEWRSIKSPGFPELCCDKMAYTLQLKRQEKGYLRLVITDIDMEPGSHLLLYDGPDEESPPFSYQPELYGHKSMRRDLVAWRREGVQSTGQTIHLQFVPKTGGFKSNQYRGFRATVWATTSLKDEWDKWPTSDLCPFIRPSELGGVITLRPIKQMPPRLPVPNPILDCIWQVKLPPEAQAFNWKVYMRFLKVNFDTDGENSEENFSIEVRNTSTSAGSPLFQYGRQNNKTTLQANAQPEGAYMSREGLYIRTEIPYSMQNYAVKFVYGLYTTIEDCDYGPGLGGGVKCAPAGMCVLASNVCDDVPNCSDNSDEVAPRCTSKTTTTEVYVKPPEVSPRPKTTTTTTTTPAGINCKQCPDGRCIVYWADCGDDCVHPDRVCGDGSCRHQSARCPEDPCPTYKPFQCDGGETCVYMEHKCDESCDCDDCTDEDCFEADGISGSAMRAYIIIPVVSVLLLGLGCWYCCTKKAVVEEQQGDAEFDSGDSFSRPAIHTPRSNPVPAAGYMPPTPRGARVTENGETVIPLIPLNETDRSTPSAPPPPSYEEVISSGIYPEPSAPSATIRGNLPPPPSYESVTNSNLGTPL